MTHKLLDEESIFKVAYQIKSPEGCADYLSQVCGDDHVFRDRVTALLRMRQEDAAFLESPPPGVVTATEPSPITEGPGTRIGAYKLLQEIGEGGFGVVYMAEQTTPVRRKVALKIVKPGMDSKLVIARFEAERQALALMDHPNIAKVLDAGATQSGRPYFVMELVNGVKITEYCDTNKLPTRQRLELFVAVCRAIQHAHQKGVIHRDLKPSNIMVTLHDGQGVPKIIDFGVAKALHQQLTDRTVFTLYGQIIGTPQYMSPEQAELSGLDLDTRSDVYSLGVLLYELLVGCPPFDGEQLCQGGIDEMRRVIREQEPRRPSAMVGTLDDDTATAVATHRASRPAALCKVIRGELDWIVMKALEKDRNRRYATAVGLAEDVERHLRDEPVVAGPPSKTYRLWKIFRRHRAACLSAAAVVLAMVASLAASSLALQVAREDRDRAQQSEDKAVSAKDTAQKERDAAKQQREKARVQARNAEQTLELLLGLLSKGTFNRETGKEYTVQEALDDLASNLGDRTELPPDATAQLHLALGKAYFSAAQLDRASKHLEQRLKLVRKASGPRSLEAAQCLRYLGFTSRSTDLMKDALAIEREAKSTQDVCKTLTLLGGLLYRQWKLDEAQRCLSEACDLFDRNSSETVDLQEIPFMIMSDVLRAKGQVAQAEKQRAKAIAVAKGLFNLPRSSWHSQGTRYQDQGQFDLSLYAFLVAADLRDVSQAGRLPSMSLGIAYRCKGEHAAADELFGEGIAAVLEMNLPDSAVWRLMARTRVRCDAHDFESAERFLREALDCCHRGRNDAFGNLWLRYELAGVLDQLGKTDEARELYAHVSEALQERAEKKAPSIWEGGVDRLVLANAMLRREEQVETADLLRRLDVEGKGEARNAWRHPMVERIKGLAHERLGDMDAAMQAYETAAKDRMFGNDLLYIGWVESRLLELLIQEGHLLRARDVFTELLQTKDRKLFGGHPVRAFARVHLAKVLIHQGVDLDRAQSLLLEAREILRLNDALVPAGPKQEITELLSQAKQMGESGVE